jgi:hypothetical protein
MPSHDEHLQEIYDRVAAEFLETLDEDFEAHPFMQQVLDFLNADEASFPDRLTFIERYTDDIHSKVQES